MIARRSLQSTPAGEKNDAQDGTLNNAKNTTNTDTKSTPATIDNPTLSRPRRPHPECDRTGLP